MPAQEYIKNKLTLLDKDEGSKPANLFSFHPDNFSLVLETTSDIGSTTFKSSLLDFVLSDHGLMFQSVSTACLLAKIPLVEAKDVP